MAYVEEGSVGWWLSRIVREHRGKIGRRLNNRGLKDLLGPNEEFKITVGIEVVEKQPALTEDGDESHHQE